MASPKVSGILYFFHGSGDNGPGINAWVDEISGGKFNAPYIKVVYPTAPTRKYSLFDGELANVWFDRKKLSPISPEDRDTVDPMCETMRDRIKADAKASGVPLNRVMVGGFSMGGALALHLAYRYMPQVAGVFAISSFLNKNSQVYSEIKANPPSPPLLMMHGKDDTLVHIAWAERTYEQLVDIGVKAEFLTIPNTEHELSKKGIHKLKQFILDVLPPTD